jgi:excisionase family DNA binding protein
MKEELKNAAAVTPMLFPYEPEQFWQSMRNIVREEVGNIEKQVLDPNLYQTPGMAYKPLYKMAEVCSFFQVTKPTIYAWVKDGKLKPYKIRSRVFFLWQDIQQLLQPNQAH